MLKGFFFKFEKTKAIKQLLSLWSSHEHILDDNTEIVRFVRGFSQECVFYF